MALVKTETNIILVAHKLAAVIEIFKM